MRQGERPRGVQGSLSGKQAELSGKAWEGAGSRAQALGLGRESQRHCRPGLCQRLPRARFHRVKARPASCHDPTISQTSTPTRREGRERRAGALGQTRSQLPTQMRLLAQRARGERENLLHRARGAGNVGSLTGLRNSPRWHHKIIGVDRNTALTLYLTQRKCSSPITLTFRLILEAAG